MTRVPMCVCGCMAAVTRVREVLMCRSFAPPFLAPNNIFSEALVYVRHVSEEGCQKGIRVVVAVGVHRYCAAMVSDSSFQEMPSAVMLVIPRV